MSIKRLLPQRKVVVGASFGITAGTLSALYFTLFHHAAPSDIAVWFPMLAGVITHFIAAYLTPSKKITP
jgi:hypothetical protein